MIEQIIEQLKSIYLQYSQFTQSNQMLGAAVGAAVVGSLMYAVRAVPAAILKFIKSRVIVGIDLHYDDNWSNRVTFDTVSMWIQERTIRSLTRRVAVGHDSIGDAFIKAGSGRHYFFAGWRLYWCSISRDSSSNADMTKFTMSIETFAITTKPIISVINPIIERSKKKKPDGIVVKCRGSDGWVSILAQKRHMSTVAMNHDVRDSIRLEIERFQSSRDRYLHMGISYKLGILLEGPPGTGKTSIIRAIATETGRDIYTINVGSMSDAQLMSCVMAIPSGSILALEDIDCVGTFVSREISGGEGPAIQVGCTLSGLLNVLDGIRSPVDLITIMTTNYPEKIDPAILRKGRTDLRVHVGKLSCDAVREYCRVVLGFDVKRDIDPILGCELQHAVLCSDGDKEKLQELICK